jgi:phospholipase/carboxylesterase
MTRMGLRVTLLVVLALSSACSGDPDLQTIVRGGDGPPTMVLLHGYGSSAEDWESFTTTIEWPPPGRFVFPQAPDLTIPSAGRAWWPLDLLSHVPPGQARADLSNTRPPGLGRASRLVQRLLAGIAQSPGGPIVLGGFSQGAMVSAEVAFRSDTPLAALVLLSGTTVDVASWRAGYSRRRGLPVFISHGRLDDVLSFEIADRLRQELQGAGMRVTWVPFEGGHETPAAVIDELNRFLVPIGR